MTQPGRKQPRQGRLNARLDNRRVHPSPLTPNSAWKKTAGAREGQSTGGLQKSSPLTLTPNSAWEETAEAREGRSTGGLQKSSPLTLTPNSAWEETANGTGDLRYGWTTEGLAPHPNPQLRLRVNPGREQRLKGQPSLEGNSGGKGGLTHGWTTGLDSHTHRVNPKGVGVLPLPTPPSSGSG